MSKNIVICCDSTNNQFGVCNTDVVRVVQIALQDPERQLCYYDPGVGTLPELGFVTSFGRKLSQWRALAFATDLHDKISIAYAHLMELWEPGDKVFIFGFSRGAYTARVLAAVVHALELLPSGNTPLAVRDATIRITPAPVWTVVLGSTRVVSSNVRSTRSGPFGLALSHPLRRIVGHRVLGRLGLGSSPISLYGAQSERRDRPSRDCVG
jgi:hypothetical protein